MNLLPPNPTPFDYFHAIRALASREGSKAIFDLADAGMNLPEPKGGTPETDDEAIRHCANWSNCGDHVREIVFADFARTLERQRNEARAERDALADALREIIQSEKDQNIRSYGLGEIADTALATLNQKDQ